MAAVFGSVQNLLRARAGVLVFWLMAALAVPVWVAHDSSAWDVEVYGKALSSLQAGHDPYQDATEIQKLHHAVVVAPGGNNSEEMPPYSYVYSPITLPVLRALGHVPRGALISGYWAVYIAGVLAAVSVAVSFARAQERSAVLYVAGVATFFPGLLANGTVLGGNVAYILYGAVLVAALRGWRTNRWLLFHAAVLLASCVKAPLLSLALIPALSGQTQWRSSLVTMGAGVALFVSQMFIWPTLFHHFLEAVELQFSLNHDFGCSPAGLAGQILYHYGLPYSPESSLVYAAYALPVTVMLFYLSRRYLRGAFTLEQWAPVMLLGIILLNPRILEYDVAPITIPMVLVCWRVTSSLARKRIVISGLSVCFVVLNAMSLYSWEWRKAIDGPLLTALFCGGCWLLMRNAEVNTGTLVTQELRRDPAITV